MDNIFWHLLTKTLWPCPVSLWEGTTRLCTSGPWARSGSCSWRAWALGPFPRAPTSSPEAFWVQFCMPSMKDHRIFDFSHPRCLNDARSAKLRLVGQIKITGCCFWNRDCQLHRDRGRGGHGGRLEGSARARHSEKARKLEPLKIRAICKA